MAIVKYYATVSQEGETGPIRGKIPTGLVRDLRADSGDMIEFEVQGRMIVGGKVLTEKEANRVRNDRASEVTVVKKTATKAKAKVKASTAPAKTKSKVVEKTKTKTKAKTAPAKTKGNKRKTRVDYEEPAAVRRPKKKKGGLSFKSKRK